AKSGWINASFPPGKEPPVEMLREWIDESYRAVAPKKLVAQLGGAAGAPTKAEAAPARTRSAPARKSAPAAVKKAAAKKAPAKKAAAKKAPAPARTRRA
ncbi:MAG TPA: MmcQ/YjbR family DNA-binding protein, partial [Archangium sp.]|nr:MmcQ/YjbR family DNA-binding protein [Archangium sp.]